MDSFKNQPNVLLLAWRVLFGGDQLMGRSKLFIFLAAYLLIGGFVFALIV